MTSQADHDHIKLIWLDAASTDHPISLALRAGNWITTRRLDKLVRTPGEIAKLKYTDPTDGQEKPLEDEYKEEIQAVVSYRNLLQNEHGPISAGKVDITAKTRDDFLDFIATIFDATSPIRYDHTMALASQQAATIGNTSARTLQLWDKGIKRDPSVYPKLENDYPWDIFWLKFTAICKAQRVDKVLDHKYTPASGSDDHVLLQRMNEFVFSILTNNILTGEGEGLNLQTDRFFTPVLVVYYVQRNR